MTIEVTYTAEKPYLALTVIPLDENMTGVTVDNGTIITDGSRNVLVGWAVPVWTSAPRCPHPSP